MSHVFHQLYYHLIWATHSRDPPIHSSFRPGLLAIMHAEMERRGGLAIRHNAMPDHVHCLVQLPPTIALSDFVGEVKGATAFRVNREIQPGFKLRWQEGYGALTLRQGELPAVSRYIDNQEEHHRLGRISELLERVEAAKDS